MEFSHADDEEGPAHASVACSQNITVFCRLKPRSPSEAEFHPFAVGDEKTICVNQSLTPSTPQEHTHKTSTTRASLVFTFDRVYDEESSQKLLFEGVGKPLVETVCNGVNATVLAYGTTASGKTYTMLGTRTASAGWQSHTASGTCTTPPLPSPRRPETDSKAQQVALHRGVPVREAPTASTEEPGHWECAGNGTPSNSYMKDSGPDRPEDGLLPRMIYYLFNCLERRRKVINNGFVKAAAMEVYNENIVDLTTGRGGLKIHKPKSGQVSIVGLHEEVLPGPEAAIAFLQRVVDGRKRATTCVNAESSRSHFVFWLVLQETDSVTGLQGHIVLPGWLYAGTFTVTRLSVVDLAGSERLVKTNACGNLQVEGAMINKSLTCLGKVINCLATLNDAHNGRASASAAGDGETICSIQRYKESRFIPYRDSKLTRVLQDSLGGNSRTSILLTCSQDAAHLAENIATLRFGQRARNVKNSLKATPSPEGGEYDSQKEIHRYQNYIRALTSWGETAIVRLSDCTRSASAKHCGLQSIPVLCKAAVPSRRLGFKRANASTPCFTKDFNEDGRQAEVVDELLSGFPAPPRALQLDFTKDDMTSKIRSRLQRPAVDEEFDVTQCTAGLTAEEQCGAPKTLVPETVEGKPAEPRHTYHSSEAHNRHIPDIVPLCNSHPRDILCSREHLSTPTVTEEAIEICADRCPPSRETLSHQCNDTERRPPGSVFCQRQESGGSRVYLGPVPDCNGEHTEMQLSNSLVCPECARHVTPQRVRHATLERMPAQQTVSEQTLIVWKPARSWVSMLKGLQYLLVRRARKVDVLRRAAQLDDAIRSRQRLSAGE